MQSWNIQTEDGAYHDITYEGLSATGKARITIDGVDAAVPPHFLRGQGYFYRYYVGECEIILRMERKNDPAQLAVGGYYYGSDQPVESDILFSVRSQANAGHPLGNSNRNGIGTFLAYIITTYVNMGLFFLEEPPLFPFSQYFPYFLIQRFENVATASRDTNLLLIGVAIALISATLHLLLYALGKRWTAPLVVAFILVLLDIPVILFDIAFPLYQGVGTVWLVVYLGFHIWVLGSLLSVMRARRGLRREKLNFAEV